jgi:hypothetical protein
MRDKGSQNLACFHGEQGQIRVGKIGHRRKGIRIHFVFTVKHAKHMRM